MGRILCHTRTESESESCSVMSNYLQPHGQYSSWNSPGQHTGVGSLSLLQLIFPTQELNCGLLRCSRILYRIIRDVPYSHWVDVNYFSVNCLSDKNSKNLLGVLNTNDAKECEEITSGFIYDMNCNITEMVIDCCVLCKLYNIHIKISLTHTHTHTTPYQCFSNWVLLGFCSALENPLL